ncbi:hypothetical protein STAPHY8AQ_70195 [Staphylococcus sp. 8AQ]|nr:hypothetical protein STAPHY8AQ_70195 [Staphylococcus sp. 8AQ]
MVEINPVILKVINWLKNKENNIIKINKVKSNGIMKGPPLSYMYI